MVATKPVIDLEIGPLGFPRLTETLLLDLLEHLSPRDVANLFRMPFETVLLLTGIDMDWWAVGVCPEEGSVAFMAVDPDTGLVTGSVICVDTDVDATTTKAQIGDIGHPYTVRVRGEYHE